MGFVLVGFVGVDVVEAFAKGERRGGEIVLLEKFRRVGAGDVVEGFGVEGLVVHMCELVRCVI